MKRRTLAALSVMLGLVWAYISSSIWSVGSAWSLVPWALTGLLIGWLSLDRKKGAAYGALYGFILSYGFMAIGYRGPTDAKSLLSSHLVFFTLLGLFGALCGSILGVMGASIRKFT